MYGRRGRRFGGALYLSMSSESALNGYYAERRKLHDKIMAGTATDEDKKKARHRLATLSGALNRDDMARAERYEAKLAVLEHEREAPAEE